MSDIPQRRYQAPRHQQHERAENDAEDERRVAHKIGPPIRAARPVRPQCGGEPLNPNAANDRPDQGAASADDDPNDDLRRLRQSENGRTYEGPPVGEQASGEAGERPADGKGCKLVDTGIVAKQFRATFVFPNADNDAAEPARQQPPEPEIRCKQRGRCQIKNALEVDWCRFVARNIQRWDSWNPVETAEPCHADVEFRASGRIYGIEQDQRYRQRDDAQIDVADAPVEHEIAE